MDKVEKALETQISNISKKLEKSKEQMVELVNASGKSKHGEIVSWLKQEFGLGHGDANTLAHFAKNGGTFAKPETDNGDILSEIYQAKKAHLRPVHEKLVAAINLFGEYETSPKKGYVSLRRKKQFATLGPKNNEKFELGLNYKGEITDERFIAQKPGGMCQYCAHISKPDEIDDNFINVIRMAYEQAG